MLICHCHRISDQKIVEHARSGAETVGQVGKICKAGTECGGCVPAIRQLLDEVKTEALLVSQRAELGRFNAFERSMPIAAE